MKKSIAILLALLFLLQAALIPAAAEGDPSDVPQFATADEVVDFVREELVNRKTTIRFKADSKAAAGATLAKVCAHTGNGAEGDYLRLALNYVMPQPEQDADDVYTLKPVCYTTAEQEAAVDAYVETVIAGCTAQDDTAKARYLYDYLCKHVTFDLENLYNDEDLLKYTAYGAVVNGRAVCQGFAQLYYKLALAAGLDCRIVTGKRGDVAHAWNIIEIGEQWYHVDASSGAQILDNSAYFMKRLFDGYTISYGDETAPEVQGYSFVRSNEDDEIVTVIHNGFTFVLNRTSGELVISGTGDLPLTSPVNSFPERTDDLSLVKSVVISEGITSMNFVSIWYCLNMKEISFPSTITSIEIESSIRWYPEIDDRFPTSMESIYLNPENPVYSLRNGCLIHNADKELILGTNNSVIPNDGSVETIGKFSFYRRKGLTELYLPSSVTTIGTCAFYGCTGLQTIDFADREDSNSAILQKAFYGCTGLTELNLPEGLVAIKDESFAYCTELRRLSFPKTAVSIWENAFFHCGKLESITVDPENEEYYSANNCLIHPFYNPSFMSSYPRALPLLAWEPFGAALPLRVFLPLP